jgi:hypothetical protein
MLALKDSNLKNLKMTQGIRITEDNFEIITHIEAPHEDVLKSVSQRVRRNAQLLKAATSETYPGQEVIITLEERTTCTRLRTQVLATGHDRVLLRGGISVPLACIHEVRFT